MIYSILTFRFLGAKIVWFGPNRRRQQLALTVTVCQNRSKFIAFHGYLASAEPTKFRKNHNFIGISLLYKFSSPSVDYLFHVKHLT